ncbi:hypothetical protein [Demetria terragena]|uniref:hypothetical protein n=1 Tax=Demetria terragena TaxID=63959 RepID=UPI00036CB470|nr:hypothetical protein [Demetria terragena]
MLKAGGPNDSHIARELRAHRDWLAPWTTIGRAPEIVHGDSDLKMIVTRYLPADLVQGSSAAGHADTYRQAGELLAILHRQSAAYGLRLLDDLLRAET